MRRYLIAPTNQRRRDICALATRAAQFSPRFSTSHRLVLPISYRFSRRGGFPVALRGLQRRVHLQLLKTSPPRPAAPPACCRSSPRVGRGAPEADRGPLPPVRANFGACRRAGARFGAQAELPLLAGRHPLTSSLPLPASPHFPPPPCASQMSLDSTGFFNSIGGVRYGL